jgi:hypothetical protein
MGRDQRPLRTFVPFWRETYGLSGFTASFVPFWRETYAEAVAEPGPDRQRALKYFASG